MVDCPEMDATDTMSVANYCSPPEISFSHYSSLTHCFFPLLPGGPWSWLYWNYSPRAGSAMPDRGSSSTWSLANLIPSAIVLDLLSHACPSHLSPSAWSEGTGNLALAEGLQLQWWHYPGSESWLALGQQHISFGVRQAEGCKTTGGMSKS